MNYEKALEAFKQLYEEIDKDNWLFVGIINPEMIKVAINCIEQIIRLDNIMRCQINELEHCPKEENEG